MPASPELPPTTLTRYRDRGSQERTHLDALLDEVLVGTLSTVADGQPWSLPTFFARDGDRVLLHGSTGSGILRHAATGAPLTLTVFALDAIVVAHTTFDSSANYRSAVLRGTAHVLEGDDAAAAMDVVSDKLIPGRVAEVRTTTGKELAATLVLALPIADSSWVYKARIGGAGEPDEETSAWAGVVPLRTVAGEPVPEPWLPPGTPVPPSVEGMRHRLS